MLGEHRSESEASRTCLTAGADIVRTGSYLGKEPTIIRYLRSVVYINQAEADILVSRRIPNLKDSIPILSALHYFATLTKPQHKMHFPAIISLSALLATVAIAAPAESISQRQTASGCIYL